MKRLASGSRAALWTLLALALLAPRARAQASADSIAGDEAPTATVVPVAVSAAKGPRLEALVPELANAPYHLDAGVRPYLHRLAFSPGFGSLGSDRLFAFRVAYNPSAWLGYEGSIEHNPGRSVHAALHTVNAIVRRPRPGRLQPYLSVGYGMMMVFPGRTLNADPVTKNAVAAGGGLELYIRSDLALRGEMRRLTVFGRQGDRDGVVAFDYLQQTIGLEFYRTLKP